MRDFRVAVGNSLKGKISELGFFLQQIAGVTRTIEQKHLRQDYPLNVELDKLNYFFSAYLNAIQSLKDGFKTAMGVSFSWNELSPTYGDFIFYCRNAATHDGYHLINSGQGTKNYIIGPLRRIDGHGKIIPFDPPREDILTLCCNLTDEILTSLSGLLKREGAKIPVAEESDFKKAVQASLAIDFIPKETKELIKANLPSIDTSFKGVKIDIVQQTNDAISLVAQIVAHART
ncbi:hypothetical protein [uncultured Tolumonas sp.]|uniref:hypothetical protein n=1 Tax=uncultured Tolumonas sp. TaxID=263765 RepID=UPI002931A838|nr:hypothetical protein [uncultured Tolumonas sp.]